MKKALFTCILSITFISFINAQCPVGDVTLTTQAEVDAYNFTSCSTISGNLTITDNPASPTINNLSNLNSITSVTGNVTIKNLTTTGIPGLSGLSVVGGRIDIADNTNMTSLGLSSLTTAGDIFISNNDALESLSGLGSLTTIGGLFISENDNFNSLAGISSLTTLNGSLSVSQSQITSFSGLNITTINGDLMISENPQLTSLSGLSSLETVGNLSINNNDALTSISDLGNLDNVSEISITNNDNLDNCNIAPVCNLLSNDSGAISIDDNKAGSDCENFTKVEAACNAAMPVELTYFKAQSLMTQVILTWQTASESYNDYFSIEHSTDGKFFNAIGTVRGNGTTNSVKNYQFTHANPSKGANYYRLKQVDFNRKFEYSDIVSVVIERIDISVFPNPTKGSLEISSDAPDGNLRVKDSMGKMVVSQNLNQSTQLDLSNLPKGMYFIEIQTDNQIDVKRIIKE